MTDQEIIEAMEKHRLQQAAQQMQGMVAAAMFGTQAAAPASGRPSMQEIIAQVEAADRRASMNFQDPQDQQAQAVLGILLDL